MAWFGLSLYLPYAVACLSTILLPWLYVVVLSSYGELLLCLVILGKFYLAHPSVLVNVGTLAKLSIQGNVISQLLFVPTEYLPAE